MIPEMAQSENKMRRTRDHPCQTLFDTLKFSYIIVRSFVKYVIAVVKSAAYYRCCNSFTNGK